MNRATHDSLRDPFVVYSVFHVRLLIIGRWNRIVNSKG